MEQANVLSLASYVKLWISKRNKIRTYLDKLGQRDDEILVSLSGKLHIFNQLVLPHPHTQSV